MPCKDSISLSLSSSFTVNSLISCYSFFTLIALFSYLTKGRISLFTVVDRFDTPADVVVVIDGLSYSIIPCWDDSDCRWFAVSFVIAYELRFKDASPKL